MESKRQLQKENTRRRILEAAYRVYSAQGFTAATAAIAKEAGVSHGAIFVHFPTLNELLTCLTQDFAGRLGLALHELAEESGDMETLIKSHLDVLSRYEDFYIRLITEKSLLPEDARIILADLQTTAAYHFGRVFDREIKNRTVKAIPAHMVFNTWLGLVHYYLQNKDSFSPEGPLLARYGPELTSTFLSLIQSEQQEVVK